MQCNWVVASLLWGVINTQDRSMPALLALQMSAVLPQITNKGGCLSRFSYRRYSMHTPVWPCMNLHTIAVKPHNPVLLHTAMDLMVMHTIHDTR